jgi:hypothetical protein
VDSGLILDKYMGLLAKWRGFLYFKFIFEMEKRMESVHGSWTATALVHGGPGIEATAVAHRWTAGTVPLCAEPHRS